MNKGCPEPSNDSCTTLVDEKIESQSDEVNIFTLSHLSDINEDISVHEVVINTSNLSSGDEITTNHAPAEEDYDADSESPYDIPTSDLSLEEVPTSHASAENDHAMDSESVYDIDTSDLSLGEVATSHVSAENDHAIDSGSLYDIAASNLSLGGEVTASHAPAEDDLATYSGSSNSLDTSSLLSWGDFAENCTPSEIRKAKYIEYLLKTLKELTKNTIRHLLLKQCVPGSNIPKLCKFEKYTCNIDEEYKSFIAGITKLVEYLDDSIKNLFVNIDEKMLGRTRRIGFFVESVAKNLLLDDGSSHFTFHFIENYILFMTITCETVALRARSIHPAKNVRARGKFIDIRHYIGKCIENYIDTFAYKIGSVLQWSEFCKIDENWGSVYKYFNDMKHFDVSVGAPTSFLYFQEKIKECAAAVKSEMRLYNEQAQ